MKQSAARTLGVAVLGAAFAATAAGTASAAALPVEPATGALPAGTAMDIAAEALPTVQKTAGNLLNPQAAGGENKNTSPVAGLLGGLPTDGLAVAGLTTSGLTANGLPIGR